MSNIVRISHFLFIHVKDHDLSIPSPPYQKISLFSRLLTVVFLLVNGFIRILLAIFRTSTIFTMNDNPLYVDSSKSGLSRFDKILLNAYYPHQSRDSLDSGVLKDIKQEETSQQPSPTLVLPKQVTTSRDSVDSGVSKTSRALKQSLDSILDDTATTHVQQSVHRIIIESTSEDIEEALGYFLSLKTFCFVSVRKLVDYKRDFF